MYPFTAACIECALWSSTDNSRDDGGDPLDQYEGDIAPETLAKMESECADFQSACAADLDLAYSSETIAYDAERAGHDFWLTRNHHGAGYWDRDLGDVGDRLTQAAHAASERYLYIGDAGIIYQA